MSRTLRVPLFPLSGAILFPRAQLPLHIFEPRYREMVRDAIEGAGRIAMIQPLRFDDDNHAPLYAVGCIGDLVSIEELDDGRFNIVLLGSNRFRLVDEAEADFGLSLRRRRHRRFRRQRAAAAAARSARRGRARSPPPRRCARPCGRLGGGRPARR